jgi:hypothetical protein
LQADRVAVTATTLLDVLAARLPDVGYSIPARRYVTIGIPAIDCDQLVVAVDRVIGHEGNPSVETTNPLRCLTMRAVELSIWLVRCAPVLRDDGSPPAASAIQTAALEVAEDPPRILQALLDAYRDGDLGSIWGVVFLDWRAIPAQGGFHGGVQRVRYDLSAPTP